MEESALDAKKRRRLGELWQKDIPGRLHLGHSTIRLHAWDIVQCGRPQHAPACHPAAVSRQPQSSTEDPLHCAAAAYAVAFQ